MSVCLSVCDMCGCRYVCGCGCGYVLVYVTTLWMFQMQQNVWLFMELMDTCIETLLKRSGPIPEPILGTILVSVCNSYQMLQNF